MKKITKLNMTLDYYHEVRTAGQFNEIKNCRHVRTSFGHYAMLVWKAISNPNKAWFLL